MCYLWREQERLYLHVLLNDWQEPELAQAFAASSGLCWWHTLRLTEQGKQHTHLQAVLVAQQSHLQRLQDELHEFIRKQDYRLAASHMAVKRMPGDAWWRCTSGCGVDRAGRGRMDPKGGACHPASPSWRLRSLPTSPTEPEAGASAGVC